MDTSIYVDAKCMEFMQNPVLQFLAARFPWTSIVANFFKLGQRVDATFELQIVELMHVL